MKVYEIHHCLLGESTLSGARAALVRLAGCNLRCTWCDTRYAWEGGEETDVERIVAVVGEWDVRHVLITGGEPLLQKETIPLAARLLEDGFSVVLETNGSRDISSVPAGVMRVVDFKCPGSGQADTNRFDNAGLLTPDDNVKFVIADRTDYEWARGVADCYGMAGRCPVLFSPVHGALPFERLAEWILADRLDARLHLQMHKIVWGPDRRGV